MKNGREGTADLLAIDCLQPTFFSCDARSSACSGARDNQLFLNLRVTRLVDFVFSVEVDGAENRQHGDDSFKDPKFKYHLGIDLADHRLRRKTDDIDSITLKLNEGAVK